MNCHDFEEWLQAQLDGAVSEADAPATAAHRDACRSCRELYTAAKLLTQSLAHLPAFAPPERFAERTVALVLAARRSRTQFRMWISAVAAAILVGVGLWGWQAGWLSRQVEMVQPRIPAGGPNHDEAYPSVQGRLAEARRATVNLTRQLAQQAAEQGRGLLPHPDQFVPHELFPSFETPALTDARVETVGRVVSDGLEPVSKSTRRAFDMFVRMLPATDELKP